jgi:hypothetical protein
MKDPLHQAVEEKAREAADKIIPLTGFGMALHINDILPDIRDALTDIAALSAQIERERTEKLWGILDDIDSIPDMLHPNTPEGHEQCWKMMVKRADERHDVLETDGYKLFTPTHD